MISSTLLSGHTDATTWQLGRYEDTSLLRSSFVCCLLNGPEHHTNEEYVASKFQNGSLTAVLVLVVAVPNTTINPLP